MLDIEPVWFLTQMGSFLLFLFLLNIILFRPFLKVLAQREDRVKSSLDAAGQSESEREAIMIAIQEELSEAHGKAKTIVAAARDEGTEEQKKLLDAAQSEATEISDKAAEELRAATESARAGLRADVEKIAADITKRLVGGQA